MIPAWQRTLLAALLATSPAALAEHPAPVHWTANGHPGDRSTDTQFQIELAAVLDPGWHIYALDEPDGGPLATEITVAPTDPVTLLSVDEPQPPQKVLDPFYRQPLALFTHRARFTLTFRTTSPNLPPGTQVHVRVRYQACSATACLAPRTELFEVPLLRPR